MDYYYLPPFFMIEIVTIEIKRIKGNETQNRSFESSCKGTKKSTQRNRSNNVNAIKECV